MPTTITTAPKDAGVFTLTEINDLFTEIATVLNNKIDLSGGTTSSDLDCGVKQVINVPDPVADSDLVPLKFLEALV